MRRSASSPRLPRRDSGYRDYDQRDVHTSAIHRPARATSASRSRRSRTLLELWHDRGRSSADVKALALARADELGRKAARLHAMRRALEQLAADCHGDDRPDCPILDDLGASDLPAKEPKHHPQG